MYIYRDQYLFRFLALTTCAEIRKGPCFRNQRHAGSHNKFSIAPWRSPPAHGIYFCTHVVMIWCWVVDDMCT